MQYAIIGLAVGLTIYLLQKSSAKPLNTNELQSQLRLVRFYWYIGLIGILAGLGFMVGVLLSDDNSKWLLAVLFLVIFGLPSSILLISYRNIWFRFDEDGIIGSNFFGKVQRMKWSEISSLKFSTFSSSFIFKNHEGKKLKLHMHTKGISQVLRKMEEKTEFRAENTRYKNAIRF